MSERFGIYLSNGRDHGYGRITTEVSILSLSKRSCGKWCCSPVFPLFQKTFAVHSFVCFKKPSSSFRSSYNKCKRNSNIPERLIAVAAHRTYRHPVPTEFYLLFASTTRRHNGEKNTRTNIAGKCPPNVNVYRCVTIRCTAVYLSL